MGYPVIPKALIPEGYAYGFIIPEPTIRKDIQTKRGKADILTIKVKSVLADSNGRYPEAQADIFLYSEIAKGGSNEGYKRFCMAVGIEGAIEDTPMGQALVMPDPDPKKLSNLPVKIKVVHQEGYNGEPEARIKYFDKWSGVIETTGEKAAIPPMPEVKNDEKDDDIPW
mgnify:CR=1 FL=1